MKKIILVITILGSFSGIVFAALSDDINTNIAKDNRFIRQYTAQIQALTNSLKTVQGDLATQQADLPEAINIETQLNAVQSQPTQSQINLGT